MHQSRQMEAIRIWIEDKSGGGYKVQYNAYVRGEGWQGWKDGGEVAGTTGRGLAMIGLKVRLVR